MMIYICFTKKIKARKLNKTISCYIINGSDEAVAYPEFFWKGGGGGLEISTE